MYVPANHQFRLVSRSSFSDGLNPHIRFLKKNQFFRSELKLLFEFVCPLTTLFFRLPFFLAVYFFVWLYLYLFFNYLTHMDSFSNRCSFKNIECLCVIKKSTVMILKLNFYDSLAMNAYNFCIQFRPWPKAAIAVLEWIKLLNDKQKQLNIS